MAQFSVNVELLCFSAQKIAKKQSANQDFIGFVKMPFCISYIGTRLIRTKTSINVNEMRKWKIAPINNLARLNPL